MNQCVTKALVLLCESWRHALVVYIAQRITYLSRWQCLLKLLLLVCCDLSPLCIPAGVQFQGLQYAFTVIRYPSLHFSLPPFLTTSLATFIFRALPHPRRHINMFMFRFFQWLREQQGICLASLEILEFPLHTII